MSPLPDATLKCGVCGFVGHASEWRTFRGHRRRECPDCGCPRDDAYRVGDGGGA